MNNSISRPQVYAAIDSERDYQEMRKARDNGAPGHSVEEFILFMEDYLQTARHIASHTWGPEAVAKTLEPLRKVVALGVACMEQHGAPQREGFERIPNRLGLAEAAGIVKSEPHSQPSADPDWASRRAADSVGL